MARRIWMAAAAVVIFALGWGAGVGFFYLKGRVFPSSFFSAVPSPPAGFPEAQAGHPALREGQDRVRGEDGVGEEGETLGRGPATPPPRPLGLAKLSVTAWAPDGALQWELRAESVEGSQSGEDAVLQDVEGVLYTIEGPVRVRAKRGEVDGRRQRVLFQGQVAVQVPGPGSARTAQATAGGGEPTASGGAGAAAGEEIELWAPELEHDQRTGLLVARGTAEEPVLARRGQWALRALRVEYHQDRQVLLARGAARWQWAGEEPWALAAEEIEVDLSGRRAEARGKVTLTARELTAQAARASYAEAGESLVLSGEAVVSSPQHTLSAREITVFLREKRVLARGEVRVRTVRPEQG